MRVRACVRVLTTHQCSNLEYGVINSYRMLALINDCTNSEGRNLSLNISHDPKTNHSQLTDNLQSHATLNSLRPARPLKVKGQVGGAGVETKAHYVMEYTTIRNVPENFFQLIRLRAG